MSNAPFSEQPPDGPAVSGYLHRPAAPSGEGLVLAHGAGSSCLARLLIGIASELADGGVTVLRCDLPFRQARRHGPPRAGDAARDREGLRRAVQAVRNLGVSRVFLGGHSYGGRQASILAAADPEIAQGLLLLSYPLHPPGRPAELRTAHFPSLRAPALFVHGSRDPFGSLEEMRAALALIPVETELVVIEGAAHDLGGGEQAASEAATAFQRFHSQPVRIPVTDVFDLHSVPPPEAKAVVEAYLEEAHRLGLKALRIVHGRGIGVQREIVRSVLARTPFVESYADAPAEAGGWGATVVTLR